MKGGILWAALSVWLVAASSVAADSATFTHDANGNLTSRTEGGVEWTYAYDSRDQLREVLRDGTIFEVYQYDAQGRRVRKTSADGVVRYLWDGDHIVRETDDFGNTIAKYEYAGDRLVSIDHVTEGTGFYVLDALGSPVGVVRADGVLAARYHLDAWGVLRAEEGDSPNPFRFTGHQFDEATGLYYAKARYYDPHTGRFVTEDPFSGTADTPASLHRYSYAHSNPTAYLDPDGRDAVEVTATGPALQVTRYLTGDEELALLLRSGVDEDLARRYVAQSTAAGDLQRTLELAKSIKKNVSANINWIAREGLKTSAAMLVASAAPAAAPAMLSDFAAGLAYQGVDDALEHRLSAPEDYALAGSVGVVGGTALRWAGGRLLPRGAEIPSIVPEPQPPAPGLGAGGNAVVVGREVPSSYVTSQINATVVVEGPGLSAVGVPFPVTGPVPATSPRVWVVSPSGIVLGPDDVAGLAAVRGAAQQLGATPNSIGQAGEDFLAAVTRGRGRPQVSTRTALGQRITDRLVGQTRFEMKNTSRRQSNTRFFRQQVEKEALALRSQSGADSVLIGTRGFSRAAREKATKAGIRVISLEEFD